MSRAALIRLVTFLGGLYFFLEYLLPADIGGFKLGAYNDQISKGFQAVVTMAFGLGLLNLLFIHGSKIAFLRSGWVNSVALLIGLFSMITITAVDWYGASAISSRVEQLNLLSDFAGKTAEDYAAKAVPEETTRKRLELLQGGLQGQLTLLDSDLHSAPSADLQAEDSERLKNYDSSLQQAGAALHTAIESMVTGALADSGQRLQVLRDAIGVVSQHLQDRLNLVGRYSLGQRIYKLFYDGLFISLGSAMFALLGFYMAGAAYRAFRIRSVESGLMMAAALAVMLGQIPFGLWIWSGFAPLRLWLLTTPSTAAFRAIKFGAAVAGLVMAIRMWLSIESESFGDKA